MKKLLSIALICILALALLGGCAKGKGNTLKIDNINSAENTFDFVDASGDKVEYDKLFINDKEVIDTQCISNGVCFATAEGQIVRSGNKVSFSDASAYTIYAKLKYKLEDGTLTILGLAE